MQKKERERENEQNERVTRHGKAAKREGKKEAPTETKKAMSTTESKEETQKATSLVDKGDEGIVVAEGVSCVPTERPAGTGALSETRDEFPKLSVLGAPTDSFAVRKGSGGDPKTLAYSINGGLFEGKYSFEERGTIFEDEQVVQAGKMRKSFNPTTQSSGKELGHPADGTEVKVFTEVHAEHENSESRVYKAGQHVYFIPKDPKALLHIGKIAFFESRSLPAVDGSNDVVVLLQRYLRADHGIMKDIHALGPCKGSGEVSSIPGEVLETNWYSYRPAREIFNHASVLPCSLVGSSFQESASSMESHVCRFFYDHTLHAAKPLKRESAKEKTERDEEEIGKEEASEEVLQSQDLIVDAFQMIGKENPKDESGSSQAEESDIEGDEMHTSDLDQNQLPSSGNYGNIEENTNIERAILPLKNIDENTPIKLSDVLVDDKFNGDSTPLLLSQDKQQVPSNVTKSPSNTQAFPFPLKLAASLKHRWTQRRFESGQRFLFLSLMNEKAFSEDSGVKRTVLRDRIRAQGIGDLGLIDHVIKAVTEKTVCFSGHHVRRVHNEKGLVMYWLQPSISLVSSQPDDFEPDDGHQPFPREERKIDKPFIIQQEGIELPTSILCTLKDVRTSLALLQDQVSEIAKKPGSNEVNTKRMGDDLTYNIILQNVQEEMEKRVEIFRKELADNLNPEKTQLDRVKRHFDSKLKHCMDQGKSVSAEVQHLRSFVLDNVPDVKKASRKEVRSSSGAPANSQLPQKVGMELEALKNEMLVLKGQQELFLAEGGARINELYRQNAELQKKVASLLGHKDEVAPATNEYSPLGKRRRIPCSKYAHS